ncbi:MAG TPA: tRNA guanosine(34) transglycosylase Tgt [Patescibacteria group bacterium]
MSQKFFRSKNGNIQLPVFFPDATRAVLRTLDSVDIKNTKTPGVLVNTYHLYEEIGIKLIKKHGGIGNFMNWKEGLISDSGGFQVMSIAKKGSGKISDEGVIFKSEGGKKELFTPEISVSFQFLLNTDMVVVLDEFTEPGASLEKAKETVRRTISWAKRSKKEYEKQVKLTGRKPYLLGVVQGGDYLDLRKECTKALVEIGFDGLGYGGWPIKDDKTFNYDVARVIAENSPSNYLLYGLGVGKPHEIVECARMGYTIFDCVLPTRDARHKRLYVYNAKSIKDIDIKKKDFYSYYVPDKEKYASQIDPVSSACDCLLCSNYSRSYLAHLFKIKDASALRLATIHNLRFYSILMEKIREEIFKE